MATILNTIRLFLLGAWIGAAIFFSAVVAPTTFRVLRAFALPIAGEIAGSIVTTTLSFINTSGFIMSLMLVAIAFLVRRNYGKRAFGFQVVLSAVVAITTAVGEWVIAAKMRGLRVAMQLPIDQIAADNPERVAFNALHGYSVAALSIAILAALVLFLVIANRGYWIKE